MNARIRVLTAVFAATVLVAACTRNGQEGMAKKKTRIIFLHHSTGKVIWDGGVKSWFKAYNRSNGTRYDISESAFPKEKPYGWENYPFDYWNIWVRNAGPEKFMKEPTLEILTKEYDVIVFKHCFPVSDILVDTGSTDVASREKRLENYRAQYGAIREKLLSFPGTKFLVWTGAALVEARSDMERGRRAAEFARWVRDEWDRPGDNIFVWDFFGLETGGGLFLKQEYARSETDSHPNERLAKEAAPLFCQRIVDVIEGRADQAVSGLDP